MILRENNIARSRTDTVNFYRKILIERKQSTKKKRLEKKHQKAFENSFQQLDFDGFL